MSSKSTYKGNPPKYLNDFSKALASEVRVLLEEVGKLRDERRALQFEIAELMALKSKHGAGGEYAPDWKPKADPAPAPAPEAPPPADPPAPAEPAKPAWRAVTRKTITHRRDRPRALPAQAAAPPPPGSPQATPKPAWSTWMPNPNMPVTPKDAFAAPPPAPPTPSPVGLFGLE